MSRLADDMKGFVVLGVYRSTVKKQNKEKTLLWRVNLLVYELYRYQNARYNDKNRLGLLLVLGSPEHDYDTSRLTRGMTLNFSVSILSIG